MYMYVLESVTERGGGGEGEREGEREGELELENYFTRIVV